nr:Chain C, HLA CLASS II HISTOCOMPATIBILITY ANTIGEN GAMMA CHAIN [Homo sapiens]
MKMRMATPLLMQALPM